MHVQKITEHLPDFDIEVVCAGDKTETTYINNIKVNRFKGIIYNDRFFFAPQIYFYLKNNHFDIIHGHDMQSFPSWFASKVDTPFVFTPHYHGHTSFGKSRLEKAKYIFYHSSHEKRLLSKFNIPEDKLIKIVNGLDLEEFNEPAEKIQDRIIYTGRLEEYKNIHHLIDCMSELEDYMLEIIGRGPYEPQLKNLVNSLNLSDRITFIPYLSRQEYLRHLKQSECFVNLSSNETYSISTTEAMACGTYCVVNQNTGMGDFVGESCKGVNDLKQSTIIDAIEGRTTIKPVKWTSWNEVVKVYREIYNKM